MKQLHFTISKRIFVTATGALAFAVVLAMVLPSAWGAAPKPRADQSATGACTRTITGQNNAVINVATGTTCLVNLKQTGAVNVLPGAALSVTKGSVINGAITLAGARAFTFCGSSTVQGAINSSSGAQFVLIGGGGDATPVACAANHIDGAVTLNGNLGGVEIGGNSIVGALTVSANIAPHLGTPVEDNATEVEGNTVSGLTTCAGNIPPPTNGGHKNTFTGGAVGQCAGL
jgi:hypothetical protein